MRRRIQSDSEVKRKQKRPQLTAQSHSVNLNSGPKNYDMHLLISETLTENQETDNTIPPNSSSMQKSNSSYSSHVINPENVIENKVLSSTVNDDSSFESIPTQPPTLCSTDRPTSLNSVASSRTSRGSGYFSSSSAGDSQHAMTLHKSGAEIDLTNDGNEVDMSGNRTVLNKLIEREEEEEEEEGFVDCETCAPLNVKHFNNSSNIEEKGLYSQAKQRNSVTVKDINKKLSEVDHLSPVATKAMEANPQLTYVDRIILELLETERMYVRALEDILAGYILAMKNTSLPISSEDHEKLFLNIKDIYAFNRKFLSILENCERDPVLIAKHFVSKDVSFSVYTDYCTNYPVAVGILTRWMKNPTLKDFFKHQQASLRHNLPLGSYLLKPVQRILKYHLILQELVKNCDEDIEDYWIIEQALHTMTYIARHINEMKRKHEDAVHIQEIQSLLTNWQGDDLTTYGDIVMEGELKLQGAKNERLVFLFDKMILITKRREDNFLVCKTFIMCSDLILLESIKENPLSFLISPFDNPSFHHNHFTRAAKQYILTAKFLEDKKRWTQSIKRLILKNHHAAIPLHAQQSIMNMDTVGLDDGTEIYRKPRYSHTTIDDLKPSALKRIGTTISSSSLSLSGKGLIRRRSDSGSKKSIQIRPLRKTHETVLSDDVSSDSVPNTPNIPNPNKGRFSFPRISYPVSPKPEVLEKHEEYKAEPEFEEIEDIEMDEPNLLRAHDKSTKKNENTKEKKSDQYKKSVIYRRRKRRTSQPITNGEKRKSKTFPTDEEDQENKKTDMSLEDFENAADYLSSNVDKSRESVSWDIQIVEAAFERYKREKTQSEQQQDASAIDSLLIPMPHRQRRLSLTESSDDERKAIQQTDKTKSSSKCFSKILNNTETTISKSDTSDKDSDEPIVKDSTNETKMSAAANLNDAKAKEQNTNILSTDSDSHKVSNTMGKSAVDNLTNASLEKVHAETPKIKPALSTQSPLEERRRYFERLKENRERRKSELCLGSDAKTIQAGHVKEMIEHHRENLTSQVKIKGVFSPHKYNSLGRSDGPVKLSQKEVKRDYGAHKATDVESHSKQEVHTDDSPFAVKLRKHDRYKYITQKPRTIEKQCEVFCRQQLHKPKYRSMDFETADNRLSTLTTASLPLHFTSSSSSSTNGNCSGNEAEDQTESESPENLKFKNFLQPQMLLWRSYSEDAASNTRRSRNLVIEASPSECKNCKGKRRSAGANLSAKETGERRFSFKELGTIDDRKNLKTDKMSEQVDDIWNDLEKRDFKVVHSTSFSDSLIDKRLSQKKKEGDPSSPTARLSLSSVTKTKAKTIISLRHSPAGPAEVKTKVRESRVASFSETALCSSQKLKPTKERAELRPRHIVDRESLQNKLKTNSVMNLARQFDQIAVSSPPSSSRSYGRSRSVEGRKHLSDLRFSTPGDSAKGKINYQDIKKQVLNTSQRRNSTSSRSRAERSLSPPSRTMTVPRNSYLFQSKNDKPERDLESLPFNSKKSSEMKSNPRGRPKQGRSQTEKFQNLDANNTEPKHVASTKSMIRSQSLVEAFCAKVETQNVDDTTILSDDMIDEDVFSPVSKVESLSKKDGPPQSSFVAAFCKVGI